MKKRERGREKKCTSKKATSSVVKTATATYRGAEAYIGSALLVVAFCIPYNAAPSASKGCVFSTLASPSRRLAFSPEYFCKYVHGKATHGLFDSFLRKIC